MKKGAGPRHLAFSKDEKTFYSVFELTGELGVFKYKNGVWKLYSILSIYDENFKGLHGAADVKLSPDCKYLFATNRGDANVVVCFKVMKSGHLKKVQVVHVGGNSPRNLNISLSGKKIFIGNQTSNNMSVFKFKDGLLINGKISIRLGKPVCVVF